MTEQTFYGWYDDASQANDNPTFEPPRNAPCPFCGVAIHPGDMRTHSLMYTEGYANRSYFYRTHRTCADRDQTGIGMDGFILDMIMHNGD